VYKKILFFVLAPLVLAACGSRTSLKFDQKRFDSGEYSYIVISARNNASTRNVVAENRFAFKNENGKYVELSILDTQGFMIPAGDYRLTNYRLAGSTTQGNLTFSINLDFSPYVEGSFTAPAGRAVYLGRVETIITKNNTGTFKRIFNMGSSAADLEFETRVNDDFARMSPEKRARFENESGLTLEKGLLNWRQTELTFED